MTTRTVKFRDNRGRRQAASKAWCPVIRSIAVTCILFVAAALTGCHSRHSEAESETLSVGLFTEGKGIWFSDRTKELFGLEVAEVMEKPFRSRWQKPAQVYRPAREHEPAAASVLLSAEEAREFSAGHPVSLILSDRDHWNLEGKVVRLDAGARDVTGQVEGLLEFPDPGRHCAMGTFLTAAFTNSETRTAFAVPGSAVLKAADGTYVYTVNGSHLTRTRVKTGAEVDGLVEIEDGLYAGDQVVVKGVDSLWFVELSALKGGTPCCPVPKK